MNSQEGPSLFVSCSTALEPLLLQELQELGVNATQTGYRGVYVDDWDWSTIYKINYASRLATRVLLPLKIFKCFDSKSLYRAAMEINWPAFMKNKLTFAIDANVHHRELRNSLFAAQVVKDAICDQMREQTGGRPSVDLQNPDIQINLYIDQHRGIISFDTSGTPLHKRGYRQEGGEAPLQETLAAAILRLAQYSKDQILLDPCCGSGTFLIEAALMATGTPPGYLRHRWGFMHHPDYRSLEWLTVRNQLDQNRTLLGNRHLFGLDISREAVRICKINLKAAGFHREVEVVQGDFRDFTPPVLPSLVVANPPYGKRLEEDLQLSALYRALGDFLRQKCAKSTKGFILTGNFELAKEIGLATKKRHILNNGGIESRLLEYEVY